MGFFEQELTSLIDLSQERTAPLYCDFSPSERERIFQAWVTGMDEREALELQEANPLTFKTVMDAWKLLLISGKPVGFEVAYHTLLAETNFPLLDERIEEVWRKWQEPEWVRKQNYELRSTGL